MLPTKVCVPRRRGPTVPRPRLSAQLSRGIDARLTLVSAPAGFGKTTLVAAWLASAAPCDRLTAWLSLDQNDNDPTGFLDMCDRRSTDGCADGGHRSSGSHRCGA